ncbi:MAG: type II toxin-antitoxin system HicB family antitoxin [Planctomycetes bacterium]|nr:type II toxin-antitoxin system HicB family antitoxin [Planctomycetota bacterium]
MVSQNPKSYTVSDGDLVLNLQEAEEGGYIVTSPLDPQLITEAETIAEAFAMARDAMESLNDSRIKLFEQLKASEGGAA